MAFKELATFVIAAALCGAAGEPATASTPDALLAMLKGLPHAGAGQPNIVFILVDDFSMNLATPQRLVDSMPNLAQLERDGVTFTNYFVTDSLCCPSRSSIFTGKFPHNTGVFTNTPPRGGYRVFGARGNEAHTFALALQLDGYSTAMMGKYLNGYEPKLYGPALGWNEWDVAGAKGYHQYNYTINENSVVVPYPTTYLTDELSALAQGFISKAKASPFFVEIAPYAPHQPYIPAIRDSTHFPGLTLDRSAPYGARPDSTAPRWLQAIPPLPPAESTRMDGYFRMRVQSDQAVDKMIGDIRSFLVTNGLDKNTYVIFSADNGYHMGEYSLRPGKMTPFDTDIQVPLVIVGPGVPAGRAITQIAENIDLAPTFTAIGGTTTAPTEPDGQNLLPLIQAAASSGTPPPWRNMVLIEHRRPPRDPVDDPDDQSNQAGGPPDYDALRLANAMYVEYHDKLNEVGYYDLTQDPLELHNIASSLSASQLARLHAILLSNVTCVGATACLAAQMQAP